MAFFLTSSILSILTILFLTASPFASTPSNTSLQSFIRCFLENTKTSPDILYTSNSTSYESILESSVRNLRFLALTTNKKPSAIVTATSESHISVSVKCAYKHGLELRTRSGGHDYEGMSYVSDDKERPFVMVDLARFRSIDVDVENRTAWVQAGATVGEVYYHVFNKTNGTAGFPAGICPSIGIGGHVNIGGISALMNKYGVSADNVIDAKVVGVDGQVRDRSQMGVDLFWAIRGGGASFGIVAAYKLRLVDVPPVVTTFSIYRNLTQNATKLITRWQEIGPKLDENLFLRAVPQATTGSEPVNIDIQFISLFLGNRSQLLSEMEKSFPELGLEANDCNEMNWLESTLFMAGIPGLGVEVLLYRPEGSSYSFKAKSDFITNPVTEEQWEMIWRALSDLKAKEVSLSMIMEPFNGRVSNISESTIAFPHRGGINVQYYSLWPGADEQVSQKHLDSLRELYSFMTPFVSSNPRAAYYGYKDIDLGGTLDAREWGKKYFKGNFERLVAIKSQVDPTNFFRNEQSIPPFDFSDAISSS